MEHDCKIYIIELESRIKQKDMTILNLQLLLKFELMKNKIYSDIIESQTNIKLSNIIKESESQCNIYNYNNGKIPISIHDFVNNEEVVKNYTLQLLKPKKKLKNLVIIISFSFSTTISLLIFGMRFFLFLFSNGILNLFSKIMSNIFFILTVL